MYKIIIPLMAVLMITACKSSDTGNSNNNANVKKVKPAGDVGAWPADRKQTALTNCVNDMKDKSHIPDANAFCSCVVDQIEGKYSSNQIDEISDEEMGKIAGGCLAMDGPKGNWSEAIKKSFLDGCKSAELKGVDVNQYCNCMLGKLEAKFDFGDKENMNEAEIAKISETCK